MRCNPQNQMLKIFYIGKTFSKISVGVIQSLEQDISRIVIFIKKAQKLIQTFISTRFKPRSSLSLRCTAKKMFLKVLRNSQENTCVRVSFLITRFLLKMRFWHRCFPVNFAKFLRTPFFIEHLRWWLLQIPGFHQISTRVAATWIKALHYLKSNQYS